MTATATSGAPTIGGGAPAGTTEPYERPCDQCGDTFRVLPSSVRKAIKRGCNLPRFCSRACQHKSYRGEGNPKWRGGRVPQPSGYIYAYAPDHPHATHDGYVMEHRLVMEASLGRYLTADEQVHHRNHIRNDNQLKNLELMADVAEHRARHAYYEEQPCGTCGVTLQRSVAHRRRWVHAFCSRACAAVAGSQANAEKAATRRSA